MNCLQPIPKVTVDPAKWEAALARLQAGEIDRPQAAELVGLNLSTLNTRLRRGGHLADLKDVRRNAGKYHPLSNPDTDKARALAEAVAECVKSPLSVRKVWLAKYQQTVSYTQLCRKVASATPTRSAP